VVLRIVSSARKGGLHCLFNRYICSPLVNRWRCIDHIPTGHPASASFEAELLARTRHCQLFLFDHTTSSLPSALSSPTSLPSALGEFYASLDASSHNEELDYWDSRHTTQRAHLKPYRIANFDAHAMGDSPKTYTLESLMRKNGVPCLIWSHSRFAIT
jgi:hypothetical protein